MNINSYNNIMPDISVAESKDNKKDHQKLGGG